MYPSKLAYYFCNSFLGQSRFGHIWRGTIPLLRYNTIFNILSGMEDSDWFPNHRGVPSRWKSEKSLLRKSAQREREGERALTSANLSVGNCYLPHHLCLSSIIKGHPTSFVPNYSRLFWDNEKAIKIVRCSLYLHSELGPPACGRLRSIE